MARARNLKPGLFKNEVLGAADPLYTILFEGLWILADREGRLEDRPLRIKGEVFPYRDGLNIDEMLNWLQRHGFILRYEAEGKKCILVLEFVKHQNPHRNESESVLPAPVAAQPLVEEVATTVEPLQKNREEIASASDFSGTTRADSLYSDSLHSDSLIPEKEKAPRKRAATPPASVAVKPEDVDPQTWGDFLTLRKAKRAPVTQTVVDDARRECAKAGMTLENFLRIWCRRGSQGLEAAWLKPDERGQAQASGETPYQRSMRERMQEAVPEIARKAPSAVTQDATDFFRTIEATSRVIDVPALGVSP
jgi:hypothetical protein